MQLSELEVVELNEAEFERVCTPWEFDCGAKATWILRRTCCWAEVPLCNVHKEYVDIAIALSVLENDPPANCRACGTVVEFTWNNFVFVRL